ncbi:MAG: NUDIX domain-containing protein, partial [Blastocatellia bacterium]
MSFRKCWKFRHSSPPKRLEPIKSCINYKQQIEDVNVFIGPLHIDCVSKTLGKPLTKLQISAGGVAFRNRKGRIEVALISVGPENRWQLPKGIVDKGESTEQAAIREVREEAGVNTEVIERIDKVEYWY